MRLCNTVYVFDTNTIIRCFDCYNEDIFPCFWERFNSLVKEERILSVREVFKELEGYGNNVAEWAKKHKESVFPPSCDDELKLAGEIGENHPDLLDVKNQKRKNPVADPFVIAKAKLISGCVVTQDGFSRSGKMRNSPKKNGFYMQELL